MTQKSPGSDSPVRIPQWLRPSLAKASDLTRVQQVVRRQGVQTICEEGRCPNRGECYRQGTATFLLLGPVCTRACAFCQVTKGQAPAPPERSEPERVAAAVLTLGLRYVVLTSVARDDLPDQGAGHFAEVIRVIRHRCPGVAVEVLTPDFGSDRSPERQLERIATVLAAGPVCYNHNLETVQRLQGVVRRGAQYQRSLAVLQGVKQIAPHLPTKSGLMLGLGETVPEVLGALQDLRGVGCDRLTLGQYLRPSLSHLPVQRYWTPGEFAELAALARSLGFSQVQAGPLVRSSYHAEQS